MAGVALRLADIWRRVGAVGVVLAVGGAVVVDSLHAQSRAVPVQVATIELRIGDQNGEKYEFENILANVFPTASGGVLVPQEKEADVREFDTQGKYVRTIGRRGAGPGEFQGISTLGRWDDTVWVTDGKARRITVMAPGARTVTIPIEAVPTSTKPVGITRARVLLFDGLVATSDFRRDVRAAPTVLVDAHNHTTLLTRTFAHATTSIMVFSGAGVTSTSITMVNRSFSQDGLVALSNDGQWLVMIDRRVAPGANAGVLPVDVYDAHGVKKNSFTVQRTPVAAELKFFDVTINKTSERLASMHKGIFPSTAAARKEVEKQLNLPATYPLAGGLVVENENSIWIAEPYGAKPVLNLSTLGTDPGIVWERFDMKGVLRQRVRIPVAVKLQAVQDGAFWGTALDADEVQYVVRLKVKP